MTAEPMRRPRPGFLLLVSATLVVVCTATRSLEGQTTTRDSSGITIVESSLRTPLPPAFRLAAQPVFDVGGASADPRAEFPRLVNGAVRLSDGRLVAAGSLPIHVAVFDTRGNVLATLGRPGQGPGEHSGAQSYVYRAPGDTVAVFAGGRVSYFAPNYRFVAVQADLMITPVAFVRGSIIGTWGRGDSISVVRVGRQGTETGRGERAILATFFNPLRVTPRRAGTSAGGAQIIVGDVPPFAPSLSLAADDARFVVGDSRRYELREFSDAGTLRRIIRVDIDLRIGPADIERYRQAQLLGRSGDARRAAEQRLRETTYPDEFPAFQRLLIDADGRLWVEDFQRPGVAEPRWTVFTPTGEPIGFVSLPEGFRLFEVGRDYVLGRSRDGDGFARVRIYSMTATRDGR